MVSCQTLTVAAEPTQGFTLSADKISDSKPFEATLTISYPVKPNETVSIVQVKFLGLDTCIQDVVLDATGSATALYQVNESHEIYIIHGLGCCTFAGPQCTQSNRISFKVGTNWEDLIVPLAIGLGGVYLLGSLIQRD